VFVFDVIAVFLRREAGDGELAAIHAQARYVHSFRRRVVRDVNDLLEVMVGLLLARARVLVAKVEVRTSSTPRNES
jgi:hypothetical protein